MNNENSKINEAIASVKTYFNGVKTEWGRISWPQKNQVIAETFSVIVIVFSFTVAIYIVDLIFKSLLGLLK